LHEQALRVPAQEAPAPRPAAPAQAVAALRRARRVLLVRLRSLGDAVLMTPLPTALKAWRPELEISVLLEDPLGAVFRHHPAVSEVISVPAHDGARGRLGWISRVRRRRFDAVFNMHSGSTAGLYTMLSGAPLRVAYREARFAFASDLIVPPARVLWGAERVHTVKNQLSPLLHLGIPLPSDVELELHLDPAAVGRVAQDMRLRGLLRGRFVLLHAFSKMRTKEWHPHRFAELAARLRGHFGVPVLAIAAPSEIAKLERLLAVTPAAVGLPGLSLDEMMAWVDACGLFVGNDSGPLHVAAALKKKIVALWGSSDARVWHPWTTDHELLSAGLPCMPCPGYRCHRFDSPRCIESIGVDAAFEAALRLKPF
jgi:ADP-heptose:LPS heptosyltransferase